MKPKSSRSRTPGALPGADPVGGASGALVSLQRRLSEVRHLLSQWRPSAAGLAATVAGGATFAIVLSSSVFAPSETDLEPVSLTDNVVSAVQTSNQLDEMMLGIQAQKAADGLLERTSALEAAQVAADEAAAEKAAEKKRKAEEAEKKAAEEAEKKKAEEAARAWVAPSNARITSNYGQRWGRMHNGVDFGNAQGSSIYAAAAGEVTFADWNGGFGQLVIIRHSNGTETYYAHASQILVSPGQSVKPGDEIMLAGSTGNSTGPHLHFEVHVNGSPTEPLQFLRSQGVDI
ncbi:M23 family metallopeptidase [Natronoglycomyces albus]|uniref:M23 family metallopeptidase n=1 Tax=Natronoglycomyces albus TaxID=2811108 RepID=A0A895XTF9_9ACTN|nr:M23 family metallopeptidase [Natronoglycomyces albus]QSB06585.1 M23 family metallopeptidase [Natronoglycomyces albus]